MQKLICAQCRGKAPPAGATWLDWAGLSRIRLPAVGLFLFLLVIFHLSAMSDNLKNSGYNYL